MSKCIEIALRSPLVGLGAMLAWVVIWGLVFEGKWTGYGDHMMKVFVLSTLVYLAIEGIPCLLTFLRRR